MGGLGLEEVRLGSDSRHGGSVAKELHWRDVQAALHGGAVNVGSRGRGSGLGIILQEPA